MASNRESLTSPQISSSHTAYGSSSLKCQGGNSMNQVYATLGFGRFQTLLFIVCGLAYMADACEVNLLTFITTLTEDEWNLSPIQKSSIASAVFAGEFVGGFVWGPISDKYGRRRAFLLSLALSVILGLVSATSTGFWMLVTLRGLVGVGVAGLFVPFDILVEMVPKDWRTPMGLYIEAFWALGSMYVAFIAWISVETWGWRLLTVFTAVPLIFALICYPWLPESPRWLIEQGREQEAQEIIYRIANINKVPIDSKLSIPHQVQLETHEDNSTCALLRNILCSYPTNKITMILLIIWLCFGFAYYGVVIFDSKVFPPPTNEKFDYQSIFVISSFEVMGVVAAHLLYHRLYGEQAQSILFFVAGLGTILLSMSFSTGWLVLFMGIARGSVFGAQAVLWLITPEHYPTFIRTTAHGLCYASSRVGSFATPYWGESAYSILTITVLYFAVDTIASGLSLLLPKEKAIDKEVEFAHKESAVYV